MEFFRYLQWQDLSPQQAGMADRILTLSFPPEERRDLSEIHAQTGNRMEFWTAQEQGKILAVVLVWMPGNFIFLESLAVDPDHRNRGLGTLLLRKLREHYGLPVILEAEHPTDEISRRRVAFYKRQGFLPNAHPYVMPPLHPGEDPMPLLLMTTQEFSREQGRQLAETLYAVVYRTHPIV